MLKQAEEVNMRRIDRFCDKIREALWVVRGKQIGVLGLAFKANTDDTRFSPSIALIRRLLEQGARVKAYDPQAMERAKQVLPGVEYVTSPYQVAEDSEALVIATEWDEFRKLDWDRVQKAMLRPLVLDGRNLLSPKDMRAQGFEYRCFGRPE
jgi:UDPglucose 6-dehydrogenase